MSGEIRWIPIGMAARLLGVSRQRVHKLCMEGQLVSRKLHKTVLVSQESVSERVKASQGRLGM